MRFRYFLTEYCGANFFNRLIGANLQNGNEIKVLVYHHIPRELLNAFDRQISFLRQNFQIVEPDIFQKPIQYIDQKKVKVLITFDDGFKSQFVAAQSVLKKFNIKALFFIPTGFIDQADIIQSKQYVAANFFGNKIKPHDVESDMLPMSRDEIMTLLGTGHTLGAHTINHAILSRISNLKIMEKEIIDGGNLLASRFGTKITHFALPYGNINSFNEATLKIITERYKHCHTTIRGVNNLFERPFMISRDPLSPSEPISFLKFVIEDGFEFLYRKQAQKLKEISAEHKYED